MRHDVVTGNAFSFHGVQHADLDGDGISDLLTVGENGGNPSDGNDDVVELLFLKGLGGGSFAAPLKIGDGGGSLPVLNDVDGDGDLDVVSSQFFGPVGGQPFVPSFARGASVASFVWYERADDADPALTSADFTRQAIGTAQGPGFQIVPVADFRGDGVTRWIATNHTNKNIAFPPFSLYPEPAVYEFTPGADPRLPWTVVTLANPGAFTVTGGNGQAAPGGVGAGDIDGDGDIDLAVSGDGDRHRLPVEQRADGSFVQSAAAQCRGLRQAGGALVTDLNRDGLERDRVLQLRPERAQLLAALNDGRLRRRGASQPTDPSRDARRAPADAGALLVCRRSYRAVRRSDAEDLGLHRRELRVVDEALLLERRELLQLGRHVDGRRCCGSGGLLRGLRGERGLHLRIDLRLLSGSRLLSLDRVELRLVLGGRRGLLLLARSLLLLMSTDGTGRPDDDCRGRRGPHQAGSSTSHDWPSLVIVVGGAGRVAARVGRATRSLVGRVEGRLHVLGRDALEGDQGAAVVADRLSGTHQPAVLPGEQGDGGAVRHLLHREAGVGLGQQAGDVALQGDEVAGCRRRRRR